MPIHAGSACSSRRLLPYGPPNARSLECSRRRKREHPPRPLRRRPRLRSRRTRLQSPPPSDCPFAARSRGMGSCAGPRRPRCPDHPSPASSRRARRLAPRPPSTSHRALPRPATPHPRARTHRRAPSPLLNATPADPPQLPAAHRSLNRPIALLPCRVRRLDHPTRPAATPFIATVTTPPSAKVRRELGPAAGRLRSPAPRLCTPRIPSQDRSRTTDTLPRPPFAHLATLANLFAEICTTSCIDPRPPLDLSSANRPYAPSPSVTRTSRRQHLPCRRSPPSVACHPRHLPRRNSASRDLRPPDPPSTDFARRCSRPRSTR